MKISILTPLLLLVFCLSVQAQTRLKLSDAVAKGFVKLKIMGNDGHTGRCATVITENTTAQTLDVDIDCGQKITCSDSSSQNLVITQSEHIRLTPKRIVTTAVYAMCINAHKSSPGRIPFKLGQMAQGALLRLTKFIEQKKYQNAHAQSAVWTITDNNSLATIGSDEGDDYEMTNALRGFVATEKHITNYTKAKPKVRKEAMVEGSFDIVLVSKAPVVVQMVDAQNRVVKVFVKESKEAGILRINYSVKNTDYKAGTYYIVMMVGNKEMKREQILLE